MTDENSLGRGRGIRVWLLIPKIIAVSIYIGGLTTVLGLWIASDFPSLPLADPRRKLVLDQVSHLMVYLVVPALLVAIVFGILLLLQQRRHFLGMRWLQVKLIALVILIPAAHLYSRSRMLQLHQAVNEAANESLARQFKWGLGLSLAGFIGVMVLARLKPRLAQTRG